MASYAFPGGASPLQQYAQPLGVVPGTPGPQYPTINPQGANIPAGQVVYTTSYDASGQMIYHPFKAVPASYKTSAGIVTGIQWVPIDTTSVLPVGAAPATGDVLQSVDRIASDRSRDWGRDRDRDRDDDRYRDSYRRTGRDDRDRDRDRRSGAWDSRDDYRREEDDYRRKDDREIRRAQDRDERERRRERESRRMSQGTDLYAAAGGDAYRRESKYGSGGIDDLERRFQDLDVDRNRDRDRRERPGEYDRDRIARSRRGSMYGGERPVLPGQDPYSRGSPAAGYAVAPGGYPGTTTPGYATSSPYTTTANTAGYPPTSGIYGRDATDPSGIRRPVSPYQQGPVGPPTTSPYHNPSALSRPASPYRGVAPLASSYARDAAGAVPRPTSPYRGVPPVQRAASPYHGGGPLPPRPASPYHAGGVLPARPSSPYYGGVSAPRPISPNPGGVYPPGHIMAGKPVGQGRSGISRVPSPAPPGGYGDPRNSPQTGYGASVGGGYGGSPHIPGPGMEDPRAMPPPEGFARPPNLAQPYTPFDTMKIQDMDDFFENIPRMPLVLMTHDVYHEDWIRFMTDLSLAWAGKLPVPQYSQDGRAPKRTYLTADLIDLWNASFFVKRGIEAVLYKGRERRSGASAGAFDTHLPGFEDTPGYSDDDDDLSEDSDDDEEYDRHRGGAYGAYAGVYGRGAESQMAEFQEARRARRERRRADKKRRRQERRHRRRVREADRKYSLYLTCVTPRDPLM